MQTIPFWPLAAACAAACVIPLTGWAQPAADNAPPPPQLEKLEEGEAPAVTIRKSGKESRITEKRARGGRVTEVKVTSGASTYYLKPNDPTAASGDIQGNATRPAQWEVMQFDLSRSKEEQEAQAAEAAKAPLPPKAPSAPEKK